MKKIKGLFSVLLLFSTFSFSQVTNEGEPVSWSYSSFELSNVEANLLPSFDLHSIKEEDKINDYLCVSIICCASFFIIEIIITEYYCVLITRYFNV